MGEVCFRVMSEADLGSADELRRLAGWNQRIEDWQRFLRLEPEGCFAAIEEKRVIGTVTTIVYGPRLAWIGMMLIHPDHRRRGVGTRLMQQACEFLQKREVSCIKLDATPAGAPLYEKLGFRPEWSLTRWYRAAKQGPPPLAPRPGVRALEAEDWALLDPLDTAAFGIDRSRLIRDLASESRMAAVWLFGERLGGWGLLRPGADADYLGPVVCAPTYGASALIPELLHGAGARPVTWDIPDANAAGRMIAAQLGFHPLRALTRMYLGSNRVSGDAQRQFAIADPALG